MASPLQDLAKPGKTCDRTGCKNPPKHGVGLKLFASAKYGKHPPILSTPILFVCDEHIPESPDVITDDAWRQILTMTRKVGVVDPDRRRAEIRLIPLP